MKKRTALITVLYLILSYSLYSQNDVNSVLDYTLNYRGLTRQDITIPIEFFSAAEKSPTNDSKLILPLVKDMMVNPLRSLTWLDSISEWTNYSPKEDIYKFLQLSDLSLEYPNPFAPRTYIAPTDAENLSKYIIAYMKELKLHRLIDIYSQEEIKFLNKNLLSIFEESDNDDQSNYNIFKFNEARDTSIAISRMTMDLLARLNKKSISYASMENYDFCNKIYETLKSENLKGELLNFNNEHVQGDFYFYYDKDGIRIAIGGPGRNVYNGHFDFIIDVGGDDVYNISSTTPSNSPFDKGESTIGSGFSCIIDLAGNDYYTTKDNFALAGGLFSSSFIFDKEGDDVYESKGSGNLGAAIGGLGLIYDESGNDTYRSLSFSEGAGCFGVGLIVDRKGNDVYIANSYSQGFGMTEGVGAIVENEGNDSYIVDSRSLDIGRYNDHYVSMCQGYGLGLRPYYAGGIGLIIEGGGNDVYNADIFGQGGGYWYSLGAIVDKSGHDKYNGYQYCQGAGIHLAIGLLKDYDGWDFYQSDGVSQGCGHDFGFGLLWDVKGNDNYSAYSLSQGAGNADGIGILIDESGTDGYLNKYPGNTRGYGNQRREFGSLGIFLDMSGDDFYSQAGPDSTMMNWSQWGVFNDYWLTDLSSQVSGNNFKVPLDVKESYSIADCFIMAKTIEPRFSLWSDYGLKKLIEDSAAASQYVLTRLGTDDARETQVMRVLSQKIQKSLSDAIIEKLSSYLKDKNTMTQPEVSFACFIFGETRNPAGKDILLQLTFDDNYRVRASAINALGKINYDKSDKVFIDKVSSRLEECASENQPKKLYNKDIAFALGNYPGSKSFETLLSMLNNPYYGARLTAAENLKKFPELSLMLMTDNAFPQIPEDRTAKIAFINSLTDINENDFESFVSFIRQMPGGDDELINANLLGIIKLRKNKSSEPGFVAWCNNEVLDLQSKVKSKIR